MIYVSHIPSKQLVRVNKMESDAITWTIANVFKQLDVAPVDDATYQRLENMGSQYEYIDSDLLEQMIEAELIIMLERGN